ncbi:MAG: hypothetical protein KatS3mg027_2517 [Bacteroidia bacterium]|nr:MAG: hypothetical protein KatS3mg027_2517 [Bacteroidia bacterium]
MKKRISKFYVFLGLLLIQNYCYSQQPFDIYGPFNAEVFKDLKTALKQSNQVYKLDLSYQTIDPKLFNKINQLKNLMNLQLNSNGISQLPESFCELHNLVYFSSLNNLLNIKCSFINFPNLQYLEMGNAKMDSIPYSIIACQYLKTFKIYNNEDTLKIHKNIKYLKKLSEIVIENTPLDSCPKVLFRNSNLKTLVLNKTNTYALPDNLYTAENLETLVVENNPLETIPWNIYRLRKLRVLSFRNTKISKLPDSISELRNLEYLDIRGTLISAEQVEILKALLWGVEIKSDYK